MSENAAFLLASAVGLCGVFVGFCMGYARAWAQQPDGFAVRERNAGLYDAGYADGVTTAARCPECERVLVEIDGVPGTAGSVAEQVRSRMCTLDELLADREGSR